MDDDLRWVGYDLIEHLPVAAGFLEHFLQPVEQAAGDDARIGDDHDPRAQQGRGRLGQAVECASAADEAWRGCKSERHGSDGLVGIG